MRPLVRSRTHASASATSTGPNPTSGSERSYSSWSGTLFHTLVATFRASVRPQSRAASVIAAAASRPATPSSARSSAAVSVRAPAATAVRASQSPAGEHTKLLPPGRANSPVHRSPSRWTAASRAVSVVIVSPCVFIGSSSCHTLDRMNQ